MFLLYFSVRFTAASGSALQEKRNRDSGGEYRPVFILKDGAKLRLDLLETTKK